MYIKNSLVIFSLIALTTSSIIIPYNDQSKCENDFYFQASSLQCIDCGTNLNRTTDLLSCKCANGFRFTSNNGGPLVECTACGNFEVTSKDGWKCVKCRIDSEYNPVTRTCLPCPAGLSRVERQEDGIYYADTRQRCLSCISDTQAVSQQRICQRCDGNVLRITGGSSCACSVGSRAVGSQLVTTVEEDGICFASNVLPLIADQAAAYLIKYPNGLSFESSYFKSYLRSAQALCKAYQNFTSCQLLGNLCVLYMYKQDNFLNTRISMTDVCKEFLLIVTSYKGDFVQRLTDWPVSMPWLYYKSDSTVEVLDKTDIEVTFNRREIMKYVFVKYSARGKFLGVTNTSVLQQCPNNDRISETANEFTTFYKIECQLKLSQLLTEQTVFYDVYLLLNNKDLYPVPVLVENIAVNQDSDRSKWVLTRRIFLIDNESGRTREGVTSVIQYASSIALSYRLRDDGKIHPPLLKIKYTAVSVSNPVTEQLLDVKFEVNYEMEIEKIKRGIEISIGVLSILGIIYAGIRIISWRRRENLQMIDCTSLVTFFIFLCSALSFVFLSVLIGASVQWLFFFKEQTTVIRVLPTSSQEQLIKALLLAGFIMKFIDVIHIIYTQISFDIFFVDWERPRGSISLNTEGKAKNITTPVSIMRTLFVANEWRELQTTRRIKPTLQLILVIFFLKVVGLEHWSTTDPISRTAVDTNIHFIGEINLTLRVAVVSLTFLLIAIVQWFIFGFIYERFIGDALGDFIDFCSISNISLFVISHSYYGYYIHGRSVHGRSDSSLHELYEQFQREEDNLCGRRGLEPNTDKQTFEIALTVKFKNEYSKIKQPLLTRDIQGQRRGQLPARQNPGLPGAQLNPALERSVLAYTQMNKYLSSFMEHAILDNDYIVKDKYFMEKLLKNELQPPLDKCQFYNDDSRAFSEVLLYGQEWSLLIFSLFLFMVIDWASNWNIILAAIITYFVDIAIVTIRDSMGKKNLADKTMVDERFLI